MIPLISKSKSGYWFKVIKSPTFGDNSKGTIFTDKIIMDSIVSYEVPNDILKTQTQWSKFLFKQTSVDKIFSSTLGRPHTQM